MSLPIKHSVSVLIRNGDELLSVQRAADDDELPGIWGLPAGTQQPGESVEDLIARIGRDKLGVKLTPLRHINSGKQIRPQYVLEMELWEASMEGVPSNREWRWATIDLLRPGASAGSLCCNLAIQSKSRVSL
jgi:ADP-ribose pyrophosphatase YjhB (NUDIX family)